MRCYCPQIFQHRTKPTQPPCLLLYSGSTAASSIPVDHGSCSQPPIQHLTFDSSPFFLPCVRAERCSFRLQLREFPTAQEYVRSGYALSWATCFTSPTASLFPNNGAGHGLKHTINAWFAAQSQVAPTPAQQVSFTHGAPPHVPPTHGNRAPSIHIEEKMETHICR